MSSIHDKNFISISGLYPRQTFHWLDRLILSQKNAGCGTRTITDKERRQLVSDATEHGFVNFRYISGKRAVQSLVNPQQILFVSYDQRMQAGHILFGDGTSHYIPLPKVEFCAVFDDRGYLSNEVGGLISRLPEDLYPNYPYPCIDVVNDIKSRATAPVLSIISGCGHVH